MWHEHGSDEPIKDPKPTMMQRLGNLVYKLFFFVFMFAVIAFLFATLWASVDHSLNISPTRDIRYSLTKNNMLVLPELSTDCVRMNETGIIKGTPNKDGSTTIAIDHKVTYTCNKNFSWKDSRNKIDQSIVQSK